MTGVEVIPISDTCVKTVV